MKKTIIAGALVLATTAGASGIVAAAGAQEAVPVVDLAVSAKDVTVTGADQLKAGYTTLRFKGAGKGESAAAVFKLAPGTTHEQVEKAAKSRSTMDAERIGKFVASGFFAGGQTYTTSVLLDPSTEYAVLRFGRRGAAVDEYFTTGAERTNAPVPAAAARVTLRDYSFGGASTLPRDGLIQVMNTGKVQHHTLIMPLKKGVDTKRVMRDVKAGKEPRYAIGGPPSALTEIVSPKTTNDVAATLKPGKHLLVCFLQDTPKQPPHAALGMAKVVDVR